MFSKFLAVASGVASIVQLEVGSVGVVDASDVFVEVDHITPASAVFQAGQLQG